MPYLQYSAQLPCCTLWLRICCTCSVSAGTFIVDPGRHNGFHPEFTHSPAGLTKFTDCALLTVAAVVDTISPPDCGRTHVAL